MRHLVCAGIVAASLCTAAPRPAEAWGGGGFLFGTAVGLTAGAVVGSALVHPYPYPYVVAPPYAYPPPPYGYPLPYAYPSAYGYPPPYAYPPPFGYGYPPPAPGPVASYAAPGTPGRAGYAATTPAPVASPAAPACRAGQFYNTLTGSCDRR